MFGSMEHLGPMVQLQPTNLPDGCNFVGWFDATHSQDKLVQLFQSVGWQAQAVDQGYTLNKVIEVPRSRRTGGYSYQKTLSLKTATTIHPNELSGQVEYPESMAREIRKLLWRLEGQANTLVCLWREEAFQGVVCRQVPATAELLGLPASSLSDGDRVAIASGFITEPLSDLWKPEGPIWQRRYRCEKRALGEVDFLIQSVVVDSERLTQYDCGGVFRLEWLQLREVAAEWIMWGYAPIPYATLTGDTTELTIQEGCTGFPALLERLAELPGFPSTNFCEALKTTRYDEKVVVWRRGFPTLHRPYDSRDP